jgi:hypothetical protein
MAVSGPQPDGAARVTGRRATQPGAVRTPRLWRRDPVTGHGRHAALLALPGLCWPKSTSYQVYLAVVS